MINQCMVKWQWVQCSSSLEYDRPQLEQTTVSSMYFPATQWIKTKVFSAKLCQSAKKLIKKNIIPPYMKLIKTPDVVYFKHGWVEFFTSRKDRGLYYEIVKWTDDKTSHSIIEEGLVRNPQHLEALQSYQEIKK